MQVRRAVARGGTCRHARTPPRRVGSPSSAALHRGGGGRFCRWRQSSFEGMGLAPVPRLWVVVVEIDKRVSLARSRDVCGLAAALVVGTTTSIVEDCGPAASLLLQLADHPPAPPAHFWKKWIRALPISISRSMGAAQGSRTAASMDPGRPQAAARGGGSTGGTLAWGFWVAAGRGRGAHNPQSVAVEEREASRCVRCRATRLARVLLLHGPHVFRISTAFLGQSKNALVAP